MSSFPNEISFIKGQLNTLAALPITYPDDYQPSLDQYSKKISVFQADLPPPPERKAETSSLQADTVTITFKSAKPPLSFPLTVSTTDTISTIKKQLASQPRAPPADIQRLLLKGKALADAKLLKEYGITDGATVNLMTRPGSHWDGTEAAPSLAAGIPVAQPSTPPEDGVVIPSLVISPLPSATGSPLSRPAPIPLELDTTFPQVQEAAPEASTFHTTISSPGFWDRLYLFLRTEFAGKDDAGAAFEQFLIASKGSLTVGEIAKIRDQVGVVGMAGT
ncbi:ubiquitin family-domain-containing protein [Gautieria morchelliformis]|nr:ubiquitin family-domain-containing protein [Gautieria morchelliformis]